MPKFLPIPRGNAKAMHQAAQKLSRMGRDGDTELVHVNKEEEAMLKRMGGRGSVNPRTGLREYLTIQRNRKRKNNQKKNKISWTQKPFQREKERTPPSPPPADFPDKNTQCQRRQKELSQRREGN